MDLIPLYALFAPIILWPVEILFPYPFIVEEIAKGALILFAVRGDYDKKKAIKIFFVAGVVFALSETVLYVINLSYVGSVSYLLIRFVLTSLLHSLTFLIILLPTLKNKKFIVLGLVVSIILHYFFNRYINTLYTIM
jgi:hypothetical protein